MPLYYILSNLKSACAQLSCWHFSIFSEVISGLLRQCLQDHINAKEMVQREVDQTFPWQVTVSRHLNATQTLLGTEKNLLLFVDTYTSIANILAVTDKYESQIHGCAAAKHGVQFPGLHSACPQEAWQVQSTRFFYWTPIKNKCTGIRKLNISSISYHTY